jgi:hypothetical protein
MSELSKWYRDTFQLNTLILQINSKIYLEDNKYKLKLYMEQKKVWENKIQILKEEIKKYNRK